MLLQKIGFAIGVGGILWSSQVITGNAFLGTAIFGISLFLSGICVAMILNHYDSQ